MNRRRVARFFPPCVVCFQRVFVLVGFNMRARSRVARGGSVSRSGPTNELGLLFKIGWDFYKVVLCGEVQRRWVNGTKSPSELGQNKS